MSEIVNSNKLFSLGRAAKGALRGGEFGLISTAVFTLGGFGILALADDQEARKAISIAMSHPSEFIEGLSPVLAHFSIGWGVVGAVLNGFKPTAIITNRLIQDTLEPYLGKK